MDPYAPSRLVENLRTCYFYHTMDLPGLGVVAGEWDLRPGLTAYLGGLSFAGKRVLEIGPASGFVGFMLERQGAEVVGFDLAADGTPDLVPYGPACTISAQSVRQFHQGHVERIFHNAPLAGPSPAAIQQSHGLRQHLRPAGEHRVF